MEKESHDEKPDPAKEEGSVAKTISIKKFMMPLVEDRIKSLGINLSLHIDQLLRDDLGLLTLRNPRKRGRTKKKPSTTPPAPHS